jgi:hypothetical protein
MTATTSTFRLVPIGLVEADALRERGGRVYVADEKPGYPCRQCLRDAEVGDELILVSHDPFDRDSPYRGPSPIFLHRASCEPYAGESSDELPTQLTCRQLSVRLFDSAAMMIDAAVIDGRELQGTIDRMLGTEAGHVIHVHNASRGCWAATVERA